ncbi:MAG: 50S ribosomal protein L4 [Actinobacteria bacterium]|nr:50S ribosomal protein L4 [Actinomycetota bacterium]
MPSIQKIDEKGAVVGEHELPGRLVEAEANLGLLHEVVRGEMAARRQGTHAAKSRGQVSGGGAKPWRQKGTGRARAGSSRVSHWTGGGMAFPPISRDHSFKVNKKVRAKAYRMALGNLIENEAVRVLAGGDFDVPSTRRASAILESSGLDGPTLVVGAPYEVNTLLSFRNLPRTRVLPVNEVEVQDYIWARTAVLTEAAVAFLEGGEA